MTDKEDVRALIQKLVNKENILFTKRCNESLRISLKYALSKFNEKKITPKLLIQEEGGWMTYSQLAKKNKLELIRLKMNSGKLDLEELKKYSDCILMMHSMPGYAYAENMQEIFNICKNGNSFLINDVCGSIGTQDAKFGDIIVCSFGENKPLSADGGGFIASNEVILEEDSENETHFGKLVYALENLQNKLDAWKIISSKYKDLLEKEGFVILNKGEQGINIFVESKKKDEAQRERLIKYLQNNKLEYTECPRYIRTNNEALSVEIKKM